MENRFLFAGAKQKNQLYHFKVLKMGDQSPDIVDYTAWETGNAGVLGFGTVKHGEPQII